ncbi:GNAT family N-acetyltransferase [Bacterioplanes sanyensis]|uniref:GNAT family N-acetyltransferase n=1 Tax=Bacterioplanes sanyensis TaxID=1249553 RepID=A0A222FJE3_9GAMM|nr:GNAT family N-acetyltransferase [Bacterioplanes sanyensis]ASP39118.1 GNAT family N-acetyltransferase [Bacterioplanes sanyensis]
MRDPSFTIRTLQADEVAQAIDWAAEEGWNPGLNDAACYLAADSQAFLGGYLGDEMVACLSAVNYDQQFGFIGFYIVKPDYRGQGFGIKLWQAGLQRLHGLNIGLDGVTEQQENYKKSGFKLAYRNIRYQGQGGIPAQKHEAIVPLSTLTFATLTNYDAPFFPTQRTAFLQSWIQHPGATALAMLQAGKPVGYGVIRPCRDGYKIAPLQADTAEYASALFEALAATTTENDAIFIDIPEVNPAALSLVQQHDMQTAFETARMYTGTAPDLPLNRIYGVTSFEIG